MNAIKNFKMIATSVITTEDGLPEKNVYEKIVSVKFLKKVIGEVTYNSELGIAYRNDAQSGVLYELEVLKPRLSLCSRLAKATQLIRAAEFRYDWMQLALGFNGKALSILNRPEIEARWKTMKERLRKDWVGVPTEAYFDKIDSEICTKSNLFTCVSSYVYFGLIFPSIPIQHASDWVGERTIQVSDSEEDSFIENITFVNSVDEMRQYQISGKSLDESATSLIKFEGSINKINKEMLPEKANVEIIFRSENSTSAWNITLQRVLI